uniref:Uncharacterized protein n=1 Tax=Oryza sativa subsp. japonica TaxID=39947 RepID=Q8GVQ5_ORYSJ|nr:hypothetical protein [Oryza sativa Japonica Group]
MTDAGEGTDGEEPESEERAAARDRSDDESSAAPRLASPPPELGLGGLSRQPNIRNLHGLVRANLGEGNQTDPT